MHGIKTKTAPGPVNVRGPHTHTYTHGRARGIEIPTDRDLNRDYVFATEGESPNSLDPLCMRAAAVEAVH